MERLLRLADQTFLENQSEIDSFLAKRRSLMEEKSSISPTQIIKGINIGTSILTRVQNKQVATVESGSFKNRLFEIPDIEIDLTPSDDEMRTPEKIMNFELTTKDRTIKIEVYFDDTEGEYWKVYNQEDKTEALVKKNLISALKRDNWKQGDFGVWHVSKNITTIKFI